MAGRSTRELKPGAAEKPEDRQEKSHEAKEHPDAPVGSSTGRRGSRRPEIGVSDSLATETLERLRGLLSKPLKEEHGDRVSLADHSTAIAQLVSSDENIPKGMTLLEYALRVAHAEAREAATWTDHPSTSINPPTIARYAVLAFFKNATTIRSTPSAWFRDVIRAKIREALLQDVHEPLTQDEALRRDLSWAVAPEDEGSGSTLLAEVARLELEGDLLQLPRVYLAVRRDDAAATVHGLIFGQSHAEALFRVLLDVFEEVLRREPHSGKPILTEKDHDLVIEIYGLRPFGFRFRRTGEVEPKDPEARSRANKRARELFRELVLREIREREHSARANDPDRLVYREVRDRLANEINRDARGEVPGSRKELFK